ARVARREPGVAQRERASSLEDASLVTVRRDRDLRAFDADQELETALALRRGPNHETMLDALAAVLPELGDAAAHALEPPQAFALSAGRSARAAAAWPGLPRRQVRAGFAARQRQAADADRLPSPLARAQLRAARVEMREQGLRAVARAEARAVDANRVLR